MLDVLDLHALGAQHEHGVRVRRVDDVGDLCGQLLRVVRPVDEHGEVVQERSLRFGRIAGVELEKRTAELDARNTVARLGLVEPE